MLYFAQGREHITHEVTAKESYKRRKTCGQKDADAEKITKDVNSCQNVQKDTNDNVHSKMAHAHRWTVGTPVRVSTLVTRIRVPTLGTRTLAFIFWYEFRRSILVPKWANDSLLSLAASSVKLN